MGKTPDSGQAGDVAVANGERRVLLVEDEENIAEALRFLLEREGWSVSVHADGVGAVSEVERLRPDLLILDMMLPGRSGMDVLEELRGGTEFGDLPVLMLTARGQTSDRDRAERAGVTRFMTKPFSNREVVTAARDLVALARARSNG